MINGVRFVILPSGKSTIQFYAGGEWQSPRSIKYEDLSQDEQLSIVPFINIDTGEPYCE